MRPYGRLTHMRRSSKWQSQQSVSAYPSGPSSNVSIASSGQTTRWCASSRTVRRGLGDYYMIDFNRNWVVAQNVDVESLARELSALQDWEELAA